MLEVAESNPSQLIVTVAEMAQSELSLSQAFVTEFWRRTQEKSPAYKLALSWIEERLAEEGQTIEQMVQSENQSQAANQVSVATASPVFGWPDWREVVETLSSRTGCSRTRPMFTGDGLRHARCLSPHGRTHRAAKANCPSWVAKLPRPWPNSVPGGRGRRPWELSGGQGGGTGASRALKFPPAPFCRVSPGVSPALFYLGGIGVIPWLSLPLLQPARRGRLVGSPLALWRFWATQLAVSLVNWFAMLFVQPRLPASIFPAFLELFTMVVVPTMLTSALGIENLLEATSPLPGPNRDDHVFSALLTDFRDAPEGGFTGEGWLPVRR
jgi:hypothetical protein